MIYKLNDCRKSLMALKVSKKPSPDLFMCIRKADCDDKVNLGKVFCNQSPMLDNTIKNDKGKD
jgi:hypothetical protein